MPVKPGRVCSVCRVIHSADEVCPKKKAWSTGAVVKRSGRGGRPWRRKRERVFARDNYLCQQHLRWGLLEPVSLHGAGAGICDHIKALEEGGNDDDVNLQTLCKSCSDKKTQQEARRGRGCKSLQTVQRTPPP